MSASLGLQDELIEYLVDRLKIETMKEFQPIWPKCSLRVMDEHEYEFRQNPTPRLLIIEHRRKDSQLI